MSSSLKRSRAGGHVGVHNQKKNWQMVMKPGIQLNRFPILGAKYAVRSPEVKFVDHATTTSTFTSVATVAGTNVLDLLQGSQGYNRIGQRIQLKTLRIRGLIENVATVASSNTGRVLVVYDRQPNGTTAMWTDVVLGVTAAGATSSLIRDGINMGNRERFVVLIDEQMYLPGLTNTAGQVTTVADYGTNDKNPSMFNFDRFVNLRDMETHFNNGTAGNITDIQSGCITMFVACEAAATASWRFYWSSRVRFLDL